MAGESSHCAVTGQPNPLQVTVFEEVLYEV